MDAFIESSKALCEQLLPILGAICLFVLIIVLIRITKLLKEIEKTVDKTHGSIDLVEQSLKKAQTPLDTATKICGTIDDVHEASVKFVADARQQISKGVEKAKETINELKTKVNGDSNLQTNDEPSPEDIIKGVER